ncbi:MAG: dihydrofolate reductase [Candidatus Paceibacterota bacterium]
MICIIAAISKNNALGKENKLLWHLPKDFKFFKDTTFGHPIIMGRKTFESLPKALPGRTNIVVTGDRNYAKEGAVVVHSIEDAIKTGLSENKDIFICGGGQIYKEALEKNLVDKMYITEVDTEIDGDTFFPTFDKDAWEISKKECHPKDERHSFDFCFVEYLNK